MGVIWLLSLVACGEFDAPNACCRASRDKCRLGWECGEWDPSLTIEERRAIIEDVCGACGLLNDGEATAADYAEVAENQDTPAAREAVKLVADATCGSFDLDEFYRLTASCDYQGWNIGWIEGGD